MNFKVDLDDRIIDDTYGRILDTAFNCEFYNSPQHLIQTCTCTKHILQELELIAPVEDVGPLAVAYAMLEHSLRQRSSIGIEFGLSLLSRFWPGEEEVREWFVPILSEILAEDWHIDHENIAGCFQILKAPETIEVLYETALKSERRHYEYLDISDAFPLAVKCIWALGDIETDESREKLALLASSENEIISKKAKKQLTMRWPDMYSYSLTD